MTASNRILNRLILVLVGIAALVLAAVAVWPFVSPVPLSELIPLPFALPGADDPLLAGIVIAAAVVVTVASIAWIATRGRGRTGAAISAPDLQVDTAAVRSVLTSRLADSPDVAGVRVQGYRVRGLRMLLVTVQTSRHPDLTTLTTDVRAAVRAVDDIVGTTLPAVVHLTTGLRTALAKDRATH